MNDRVAPKVFGRPMHASGELDGVTRWALGFYEYQELGEFARWRWASGSWGSMIPPARVIAEIEDHIRYLLSWLIPLAPPTESERDKAELARALARVRELELRVPEVVELINCPSCGYQQGLP